MQSNSIAIESTRKYQRKLEHLYQDGLKRQVAAPGNENDTAMAALEAAYQHKSPKRELVFVLQILEAVAQKAPQKKAA